MEVIHERVVGLDVHKDNVAACVRTMSGGKTTWEGWTSPRKGSDPGAALRNRAGRRCGPLEKGLACRTFIIAAILT